MKMKAASEMAKEKISGVSHENKIISWRKQRSALEQRRRRSVIKISMCAVTANIAPSTALAARHHQRNAHQRGFGV
jgi:hypothetical protein